ncbi:MAG: sarcosine oxidase subunit gamma family protein [Oceanospirillaceae bacterium]
MSDQTTQTVDAAFDYAKTISAMDQRPATAEIIGESPLAHADLAAIAKAHKSKTGSIELTELKLRGHIVLRGKLTSSSFTQGVEQVLGMALPGPLQMVENGELSIRWVSPDEWLVVVPGERTFEIELALIDAMQGHCAIVNVSGGQTILRLVGSDVQKLLQKSAPFDVHDRNFPVGKVVTTLFAKTQAIISRSGDQQWELVVRRSFADYAWLWLQDACAEFDLVIREEAKSA